VGDARQEHHHLRVPPALAPQPRARLDAPAVAQLRYDPADHHWRLYCADRNSRWHYYDMAEPTPHLDELLNEIDEDPTGIFWG
jgi:Protein of unknown function (DUF3024)